MFGMRCTEEKCSEFTEEGALQRFREVVGEHVFRWTMDDGDVVPLRMIGDEEIADVDVAGTLATRGLAVLFHFNGTFVVLVEDGLSDRVTLCFHKQFNVQCVWQIVTSTDEFRLRRAFSIDALSLRFTDEATTTEGNDATSVAAHVGVDGKGCVNPGDELVKGISTDAERKVNGAIEVA